MRTVKVSKSEWENIFNMYMNGVSLDDIAKKYGITKTYVNTIKHKYGESIRNKPRRSRRNKNGNNS